MGKELSFIVEKSWKENPNSNVATSISKGEGETFVTLANPLVEEDFDVIPTVLTYP